MNHVYIIIGIFLLSIFAACNNNAEKSMSLYNQGIFYEEQQRYDSAIYFYRETIDLLKNADASEQTGEIYNRLGNIFLHNSLYEKARAAFKEAMEYNCNSVDRTNLSRSLRGIGNSFTFRSMPDSAIHYFQNALKLSGSIKDTREILLIHNNLSNVYFELGQYHDASLHNDIAIALSKDSADFYRECLMKADILMEYQKYDSARYYYELASQSDNIFIKASCYRTLSELSQKFPIADSTKYIRLFSILNDSIDRITQTTRVESADQKYLSNKVETKYENWLSFTLLSLLICLIGTVTFIHYFKNRSSIERRRQKVETQKKDEVISQLYNEMSILQHEMNAIRGEEKNLSEYHQNCIRLEELIANVNRNIMETATKCSESFIRSSNYKSIKQRLQEDFTDYTSKDKEDIYCTVENFFKPFIDYLSTFMNMPMEDCILCCLTLSKFSAKESSNIRSVSYNAIRSQKSRIKTKISQTLLNLDLYNFIFK